MLGNVARLETSPTVGFPPGLVGAVSNRTGHTTIAVNAFTQSLATLQTANEQTAR
jgi:hypothetical protein